MGRRVSGASYASDVCDEALLDHRAVTRLTRLCADTGLPVPQVRVLPLLGRPHPSWSGLLGHLGCAETRHLYRRRPRIHLSAHAVVDLSDQALDHLLAHELGHVARHRQLGPHLAHWLWLYGYLLLTAMGLAAIGWTNFYLPAGSVSSWGDVGVLLAVLVALTAYMALRTASMRAEETGADLFAVRLLDTSDGAREVAEYTDIHMPEPSVRGVRHLLRPVTRLLASHPPRERRLAVMESHLGMPSGMGSGDAVRDAIPGGIPSEETITA